MRNKYAEMSDHGINAKVAECFHEQFLFNDEGLPYVLVPNGFSTYSGVDFDEVEFDPCNNPADAWPLITKNKICLAFDVFAEARDGGDWVAAPSYGWSTDRVRDNNPLRAAMIVFLMMMEEKVS